MSAEEFDLVPENADSPMGFIRHHGDHDVSIKVRYFTSETTRRLRLDGLVEGLHNGNGNVSSNNNDTKIADLLANSHDPMISQSFDEDAVLSNLNELGSLLLRKVYRRNLFAAVYCLVGSISILLSVLFIDSSTFRSVLSYSHGQDSILGMSVLEYLLLLISLATLFLSAYKFYSAVLAKLHLQKLESASADYFDMSSE